MGKTQVQNVIESASVSDHRLNFTCVSSCQVGPPESGALPHQVSAPQQACTLLQYSVTARRSTTHRGQMPPARLSSQEETTSLSHKHSGLCGDDGGLPPFPGLPSVSLPKAWTASYPPPVSSGHTSLLIFPGLPCCALFTPHGQPVPGPSPRAVPTGNRPKLSFACAEVTCWDCPLLTCLLLLFVPQLRFVRRF